MAVFYSTTQVVSVYFGTVDVTKIWHALLEIPLVSEPATTGLYSTQTYLFDQRGEGTLHGTQTYLFDQRGEGTLHGTQTYLFDQRGVGSLYATDADSIPPI